MTQTIKFTKMQGVGNDFVVVDAINQRIDLSRSQLKQLADRHFGVGCDQILLVERATSPENDFSYRIFNADGGEVEQCGNGARCFVKFVRAQGLTSKMTIRVETLSGVIEPTLQDNDEVTVDMGPPRFLAAEIPFIDDGDAAVQTLDVVGARIEISALSMGNPHAVQIVPSVERAPVSTQGPLIEHSPRFPAGVNAGYVEIVDRHDIRLRVWERGAGETLACGTGACAAAVAGVRRGLLDSPVRVAMRGGILTIAWHQGGTVMMTGPAAKVFDGEWNVPAP